MGVIECELISYPLRRISVESTLLKCRSMLHTTQIKLSQGYTTLYFYSSVVWIALHGFSTFGKTEGFII